MTISSLKIRPLLLGAAIVAGVLAPLPALAQYDDGYGDGGGGYNQDYQPKPRYYQNPYRPHCYYRTVRVYDDYTGRYVSRRKRVCERAY
jgi:hypothetical protein